MKQDMKKPRRAAGASTNDHVATGSEESVQVTTGDVTALWAEQQVTNLLEGVPGELPEYGSQPWLTLPSADPRRPAAVITAAEKWRRHRAEEDRLDWLLVNDPDAWFRAVTEEADRYAARLGRELASRPTTRELARRRKPAPARAVAAAPGWPPVAIPGKPGWWRHHIDGQQVDLPTRNAQTRNAA